jgi:hypothetical protein
MLAHEYLGGTAGSIVAGWLYSLSPRFAFLSSGAVLPACAAALAAVPSELRELDKL